jgi:hypothetical protein
LTENKIDIESTEEYQKMLNDYQDYASTYASGFITQLFSKGIINEVDAETLKEYYANPDTYQKEIEKLAQYYYISSAEVHQLFELIESLPTLNFKIESHDKSKTNEKHVSIINKIMHKIKHKRLTRDLLKQNAASGTLVGIWLGNKSNPYSYIFDEVKYVFPAFRKNGEWQCVLDFEWIHNMTEQNRKVQLMNLSPFVTQKDYEAYLKDTTRLQYKELPQDRTFVLRTGTLKRNQNLGTSWVTAGLYDVLHKKRLKDVERSVANKIINAVAVLTIGTDKNNGEYSNLKLPKAVKQKIHSGAKSALEKNNASGVTVVSIPDFAKIEFPDVKADGLGGKFDDINGDIQSAYGLSGTLLNGTGSNFAGAKINLDTFYKRIGVMLEDVEQEVYQKLINLILPSTQTDNFYITYDKEAPLTLKEKVDVLSKLNDKGWSVKHLVDLVDGVNWESYLEQTLHETEVLKLQEKIKPYLQSSVMTSDDVGAPTVDNPDNENTVKSKTTDGNSNPS